MDREELILGITADIDTATSNLETLQSQLRELQEEWDLPELEAQVSTQVANAEQVKADLEAELADALELDATVDVDTTDATTGVADIGTKAGESQAAISQMSSNSVSELGAMAGAGSAVSQGLGDIAGAAAEGDLSLKSLVAVGVPMAALGALLQGLRGRFDDIAATKAFNAEQVADFAAALRQAGDDAANLVSSLEDGGEILGTFQGEDFDITPNLAAANITAEQFFSTLSSGEDGYDRLVALVESSNVSQADQNRILLAGSQAFDNLTQAELQASASTQVFAESQASANQALSDVLDQQDPMRRFTEDWDTLIGGIADGEINTQSGADALNRLAQGLNLTTDEVLKLAQAELDSELEAAAAAADEAAAGAEAFGAAIGSVDWQQADLEAATSAMSAFTTELFAASNEAEAREAAFDRLAASAEEVGFQLNAATDAGRAQLDALEGVARVVDQDLAQAYDNANGSQAEFIAAATQIGDETLARLQSELNLTEGEVETLSRVLGLTEGDYQARFELAGAEEARLQLQLLSGAIAGLPPDVESRVNLLILQGDFVGARDEIQAYYEGNPATVPVDADTEPAETAVTEFADEIFGPAVVDVEADTEPADTAIADTAARNHLSTIDTTADTADTEEDLNTVARPRTTGIAISILQAILAEAILITVARDRTANITAEALTGAAEAELNHAARTRTSFINVIARAIGGGSGGGGGGGFEAVGPGPLGAAAAGARGAAVPMGAIGDPLAGLSLAGSPSVEATPTVVNVNVQAAVIGSRTHVMRAVADATQQAIRLAGSRQTLRSRRP